LPAADYAARTTETDTSVFDPIGYSINNANSKEEIAKIVPSAEQQKQSDRRVALNAVVTSSLWRPFTSTMNQDLVLRHRIINGGKLDNGTSTRRAKKAKPPRARPAAMRDTLYNRNFYIPKYQQLTTPMTGLNSHELTTWNNAKYNPQGAPWRVAGTSR
jgi:hypothetical protein